MVDVLLSVASFLVFDEVDWFADELIKITK